MSNVVSLNAARMIKQADDYAYRARILGMDKVELLEEMVRFQEERSSLGHLTPEMMIRGKILFKALEESAETHELQLLTRSYRRHLEFELRDYMRRETSGTAVGLTSDVRIADADEVLELNDTASDQE